jgi:hypothetical protein
MTKKFIPALLRAMSTSAHAAVAIVVVVAAQTQFVTSASAQRSGAVPATCSINAGNSTMTCTTTVSLTGVTGSFAGGALTLSGSGPQGPVCSGLLTATPSTVPVNVATAVTLTACAQSTDRASFDYRWVSPATAGNSIGAGSVTATLAATQSAAYSVDVCATSAATALCTRVSATVTAAGPPVCTAIAPAIQSVSQNAAATALSANCSAATSYQWYLGASPLTGAAISGATSASYTPSTATLGSATYSVRATNANGSTDNTNSAVVSVSAQSTCTSGGGTPRVTVAFTQAAENFIYQSIVGQGTHATRINVGAQATDSTTTHRYTATWGIVQDDNTTFSNRTVTLSECINDFSPSAIVLVDNFLGGNVALVTEDDPRARSATNPTGPPALKFNKTYYINVRNNDCPAGANCSITGIYTNRNR